VAIPAWPSTSPAVVIVRTPEMKSVGVSGIATGPQRYWPSASSWSATFGAVFQSEKSAVLKRPVCFTLGRMR
jgi:hypothetical protein